MGADFPVFIKSENSRQALNVPPEPLFYPKTIIQIILIIKTPAHVPVKMQR